MNDLSWMLYVTNVIPSIGVLFGAFGVIGLVLSGIAILPYMFAMEHPSKSDEELMATISKFWKWIVPPALLFLFIANLVPDTTTMRLILASELGETAVTNPEVIEIFELLKENLKSYISK